MWHEWSPMKKLIWLRKFAAGAKSVLKTLTGAAPLTLTAIAKEFHSLIQYGKCTTVNGDIYCNNGKLVAVDEELPSGYKRLLGITFDGNFHYETGEYLTGDDVATLTLDNLSPSGKNVFGSYNGTSNKNFSLYIYGSSTSGSYFRFGDVLKRPVYGGTGRRTITFGAGGTSGFADDVSINPDEFTTPANTYIGMLPNSSSPAYTGDIIGSITVGTRLEWIPTERESDGVIGYYERVNGKFIAPTGDGTPVSLGYDTTHLNVLSVVGTPEVLSVGGANLFNPATVPDEFAYINKATGKTLKHANFRHSDFIAITGDVDYYFGVVGYSASTAGLAWYSDANEDAYISGVSGTALTNEGKVATAPATAKYVRFSWQIDEAHNADWEQSVYLCINGTLDAWEPYRAPQTASVENLFAVGDYKDEQNIINGAVTRRTEVSVANGIIAISALAVPVTEHVPAQVLRTAEGNNTVSVTSNVDPVGLKVEYYG